MRSTSVIRFVVVFSFSAVQQSDGSRLMFAKAMVILRPPEVDGPRSRSYDRRFGWESAYLWACTPVSSFSSARGRVKFAIKDDGCSIIFSRTETWHDTTWHQLSLFDDMAWHDMTWHDMTHHITSHHIAINISCSSLLHLPTQMTSYEWRHPDDVIWMTSPRWRHMNDITQMTTFDSYDVIWWRHSYDVIWWRHSDDAI